MSDIVNAFSPPFVYVLFDGREVKFKRMLTRQWAELVSQIRAERIEQENIEINKQVGEKDHQQRSQARMIAHQFIREHTTIQQVMNHVTRDIDGIERLLKFSAIQGGMTDAEWEGVTDLIPPMQKCGIAEEVAFMPIIDPKSVPAGKADDTDAGDQTQTPTGETSPQPSSTSTEETPATSL